MEADMTEFVDVPEGRIAYDVIRPDLRDRRDQPPHPEGGSDHVFGQGR